MKDDSTFRRIWIGWDRRVDIQLGDDMTDNLYETHPCSSCGAIIVVRPWRLRKRDSRCARCKETKEKKRLRDAAYRASERGKEQRRVNARAAYHRQPKKQIARALAGKAIRCGKMVKDTCSLCGAQEVEMHHPDYAKPYEAIWLCKEHHQKIHGSWRD